jgi:hypothetical protein
VALLLALAFLRTNAAAYRRQRVRRAQDLRGSGHVAGGDGVHEIGNRDTDRASLDTRRILAAQAALGLEPGAGNVVALVDFEKILRAQLRVALGHGRLFNSF